MRYQKTGATTPSLKFSARLSSAARAMPWRSRRIGSRPTIWLTALRPAGKPPDASAPPTAATCSKRLRCAIRMPIANASTTAPAALPRPSQCSTQPSAAAAATSTTTVTMPRSRRLRSLRFGRLSFRSKNAIPRPANTIGWGTRAKTAGMSPNAASNARPASSTNSGSCKSGGIIVTVMAPPMSGAALPRSTDWRVSNERNRGAAMRAWQPRPRSNQRVRRGRGCPALAPRDPFAGGRFRHRLPRIREADDRRGPCWADGARRILAIPGMLFAASHVKNDLPWEMNSFIADNPGIDVRLGRDLGIEPKLLEAVAERIAAAAPDGRKDALLVVVGRGTNDPDANSNIAKIARMLWEGMGFGWAEAAFSGVADPRVDAALERAARLGFRRIVVFPYFLFTGVLVKRIYAQTDAVAARLPDIEFVKAGYLRDHVRVIDTFLDRIGEFADGEPKMNCQLCKYRTQIIGYEDSAGMRQQGHHHHVRGGAGHRHDHDHPHHHDDG